ncbi:MAG TPA: phage portal protein, partial [Phycisphaerae bacterium]|nr:phage portal protein [Phycisphaerae bacterium]
MLAGLAATPATLPARQRQIVHLVRGSDGRLRASYDAAQTTDWNKRHWARADELSAAAAGSDPVRKTVRTRARYEVANNGFARGIVNTLANWTIGSGPTLQIVGKDRDAASRIEDRFHRWAEAARLGWKLWTMRVAKCVDGETFAMLIHNPELPADVKLDLRLVECDRIVTPNFWNWNAGPFKVSGIVCDEFGNPVTYHVLQHHPGNNYGGSTSDYDEVPAEHMIHLFRMDRPGQMRGVPEIMPSLESLAALRRFSLATLGAAEAAADHAVVLETEAPANEDDEEEIAELSEIELTPRMMTMLPFGTKATHIKPEHPSTTYHEYFRDKIGEAARPLDMP